MSGDLSHAPAYIPPGRYQATYVHHQTAYFRTTPKVYLHLKIYGGDYDGMRLYRAYRVEKLKGKPKKYGGFIVHHSHAAFRQMVSLSNAVTRPDRISFSSLKGCLIGIRVRTVVRDAKQNQLHEALKYSVVDELLSIDAGALREAG